MRYLTRQIYRENIFLIGVGSSEPAKRTVRSQFFLIACQLIRAVKICHKRRPCAECLRGGNPMLYIRSVLVGIATAFVTTVISMITWIVIAGNQLHRQFPNAEISFDLRSVLARSSIVWLIGSVAFIVGFYWNVRRRSQ